jgi:hypothetical protein
VLRRKIRNAGDARHCLDAAKDSGMARPDWARKHGVDARSLNAWRLNLARSSGGAQAPSGVQLVELVAGNYAEHAYPEALRSARYVVRVGEVAIEVDGEFDDDALRRLIRVAASC